MSDELSEVFGEDLAESVRSKRAQRQQERNSVSDDQMAAICAKAINDGMFHSDEGDPQFSYKTESGITHVVRLMQVPEPNNGTVWEYLQEPWEGAASLPFDYIGEWQRCTFPDKEDLKKVSMGDWCIVVGRIDTYERDDGSMAESMLVRGVATLTEAQEYAKKYLEQEGFDPESDDDIEVPSGSSEEEEEDKDLAEELAGDEAEPEPEPEPEPKEAEPEPEEEDDDDELGGFLDEDDEEEDEEEEEEVPVPYDDIANLVEQLGDQEEAVWEVSKGDERLKRLTEVVCNKLDLDNAEAVAEVILDVIEEHNSDDEDDDDGEFDDLF